LHSLLVKLLLQLLGLLDDPAHCFYVGCPDTTILFVVSRFLSLLANIGNYDVVNARDLIVSDTAGRIYLRRR